MLSQDHYSHVLSAKAPWGHTKQKEVTDKNLRVLSQEGTDSLVLSTTYPWERGSYYSSHSFRTLEFPKLVNTEYFTPNKGLSVIIMFLFY